jgi:hypothetical protein
MVFGAGNDWQIGENLDILGADHHHWPRIDKDASMIRRLDDPLNGLAVQSREPAPLSGFGEFAHMPRIAAAGAGRLRSRGYSVIEIVAALCIFCVLGGIILHLVRQFVPQHDRLAGQNAFLLQARPLVESMQRDLRSAEEAVIGSDWLKIRRFADPGAQETQREDVVWRLATDAIIEGRGPHERRHTFHSLPEARGQPPRLRIDASPIEDLVLEKRSLVTLTLGLGSFAASASIDLRARSVLLASAGAAPGP